jgi:hypothetical protein
MLCRLRQGLLPDEAGRIRRQGRLRLRVKVSML